jgi:hypothetical protein
MDGRRPATLPDVSAQPLVIYGEGGAVHASGGKPDRVPRGWARSTGPPHGIDDPATRGRAG